MKPPRFLNDLYRDLRDRHLLPLVGVLIVAIIAVPLLLSSDSEVPSASSDAAAQAAALETQDLPTLPAVLASTPGLRDYRDRLARLHEKNPFRQPVADLPKVNGAGHAATVPSASELGSDPAAGSASGGTGLSETIREAVTQTSTQTTTTTTQTAGGNGNGSNGGSGSNQDGQWFTYRVDVLTGPAGDTQRRQNVKRFTVLPSRSNPVALFLGVEEGGKKANFMVSPDVVDSRGDGTCLPDPSQCEFLTLKAGDERKFEYAPTGEPDTFVIEIKDIRLVPIDDPRTDKPAERSETADAADGLESFLGL
jgi:hypothetical protein